LREHERKSHHASENHQNRKSRDSLQTPRMRS
jgi:hypothetical protein